MLSWAKVKLLRDIIRVTLREIGARMTSIATEVDVVELAHHLSSRIPKLAHEARSTGHWTEAVYKAFVEYKKDGWKVYPETKAKKGEYLCDFMLFQDGYGPRVACESQWWHSWGEHEKKLEWSFDKLVGVKADIKVFIYEGDQEQWETICKPYLADYALLSPQEAFLTMRFDKGFHCSWWKPSRPGVHEANEIVFEPFD